VTISYGDHTHKWRLYLAQSRAEDIAHAFRVRFEIPTGEDIYIFRGDQRIPICELTSGSYNLKRKSSSLAAETDLKSPDVAATKIQGFMRSSSAKVLLNKKKELKKQNSKTFNESQFKSPELKKSVSREGERRAALLIIDVQYDFLPPTGSLAVTKGTEVIPVINNLRERIKWAHVVLTQDWHPPGHCSFCSTWRSKGAEIFTLFKLPSGAQQMMWPDHCVQGSEGAKFHKDLKIDSKNDSIVQKGTNLHVDSYSGFYDNDHKTASQLTPILRKHKITDVYVTGIAYDYCVGYSALDAHGEGFRTYVVEDATRGVAPESIAQMVKKLQDNNVKIIKSTDIPDSGFFPLEK